MVIGLALLVACHPPGPEPVRGPPPIKIVVSERGLRGGHLVAVDEHGERVADLFAASADPAQGSGPLVRDTQVAFSPDGRWLVFA